MAKARVQKERMSVDGNNYFMNAKIADLLLSAETCLFDARQGAGIKTK